MPLLLPFSPGRRAASIVQRERGEGRGLLFVNPVLEWLRRILVARGSRTGLLWVEAVDEPGASQTGAVFRGGRSRVGRGLLGC